MFINTLPLVFAYTQLFDVLEASIFLTAVFCLVYVSTPDLTRTWRPGNKQNLYNFLHSAWLGQASLWRVFWPFFLLVNAVLFYIDYRINNVTYTIASWKTVHGMLILPIVWWVMAIWRGTSNSKRKIWGALARTLAVYLILEFLLRFLLSNQYPNTLFDCRLLVIEYGDCF